MTLHYESTFLNANYAYLTEKARIELGRRRKHYGSTKRRPIYWKDSPKEVLSLGVMPTKTAIHKINKFFTLVILIRKKINTF